jgi:hypothetical protein
MEHDVKFSNAEEAVANATLDLGIKMEEYAQVHTSESKKSKVNQVEGIPTASESLVAAKSAYNKGKQTVDAMKLTITMEGANPLSFMAIYYLTRPGSLAKRSSRPK